MIYNINRTQNFATLKEFYMPAICHPILKGRTKTYQLSIPLNGQELVVKKSAKKFKYTSFANVILGSVMRMEKLFAPDSLDLGVQLMTTPNSNDLSLSFELVNKKQIRIASEEYIFSIVAEYSYKKMDIVTYFPILYRQTCTNGQVAILGDQFKETISVDKILEIGCEWTRCNFESYISRATTYFEYIRKEQSFSSTADRIRFVEKILKIKISNSSKINKKSISENIFERDETTIKSAIAKNLEMLGDNNFALYNAMTEYASRQNNWEVRNRYFLYIGRYLYNEMKKASKANKKQWSERLVWHDVEKLAKI